MESTHSLGSGVPKFGREMRRHFQFDDDYIPLNHGSWGAYPSQVREVLEQYGRRLERQPDTFIRYEFPLLMDESRRLIAENLKVNTQEVVFVPNATTATHTVLSNIRWQDGDVILTYGPVYAAIDKLIAYLTETEKVESEVLEAVWPISDDELVQQFEQRIEHINNTNVSGATRRVRLAVLDTVTSLPGFRVPFARLTGVCRKHNVLSMVDGAHGIGHIPLDLPGFQPDFFTSNLHKWLFLPRGFAVLYIPLRNQHMIRTTIPVSHGFQPLENPGGRKYRNPLPASTKSPLVTMFDYVGTIDYTNWLCVAAALAFRSNMCGGEQAIMDYCIALARDGGNKAAQILGTEVMDVGGSCMRNCAFANVRLPLEIGASERGIKPEDAHLIVQWIAKRGAVDKRTYFACTLYEGKWWWRFSAQIYLGLEDVAEGARRLKSLCEEALWTPASELAVSI